METRSVDSPVPEKLVQWKLNKDQKILQGDNAYRTLIFAANGTLARRHGQRAQRKSLIEQGMPKEDVDALDLSFPHPKFEYNISDCLDTVVIDEAHQIKNDNTHINVAVRWLGGPSTFYLCMTGTIMLNGAADLEGYLRLLEPPDAPKAWSNRLQLIDWGLDLKQPNPFALDIDHPGAVLQKTQRALMDCILKERETVVQGMMLRKTFADMVICRTYSSCVPPWSAKTVAESLPQHSAMLIETSLIPAHQRIDDNLWDSLRGRLVVTDRHQAKVVVQHVAPPSIDF